MTIYPLKVFIVFFYPSPLIFTHLLSHILWPHAEREERREREVTQVWQSLHDMYHGYLELSWESPHLSELVVLLFESAHRHLAFPVRHGHHTTSHSKARSTDAVYSK